MIYLCLGRRELGKSTLAAYLVRDTRPRIIFDPRGQFPTAARGEEFSDIRRYFDALNDVNDGGPQRAPEFVLTPARQKQVMFDALVKECRAYLEVWTDQPFAFLLDELRMIDPIASDDFDWMLRCTARERVNIVMTAHRPKDVPTDIRAITDVWCLFRMTQEHDLDVIEELCSVDTRQRVEHLQPRQFIAWDDTKAIDNETIHTDPSRWFVPLRSDRGVAATTTRNGLTTLGGSLAVVPTPRLW